MVATKNQIKLRRCGVCKKAGHNKSTCPEKRTSTATTATKKSAAPPVRFFIHHVPFQTHQSPYVVDLKNEKHEIWRDAESVAAEDSHSPYHFYHECASQKETSNIFFQVTATAHARSHQLRPAPFAKTIVNAATLSTNRAMAIAETAVKKILNAAKNACLLQARFAGAHLSWRKIGFALAALLAAALIPAQGRSYYQSLQLAAADIADNSAAGFLALQDSTATVMKGDLAGAQNSLTTALQKFDRAVGVMRQKHLALQKVFSALPIVGGEIESRQKLITAGRELALGNSYLLKGVEKSKAASSTMINRLSLLLDYVKAAAPNYEQALKDLSAVDANALPYEYQSAFNSFKLLFTAFLNDLKGLNDLKEPLQEIFGGKGLRRYLLAFQNPNEMRATGGFLGSFAFLEIKDGVITKLDIPPGGAYDVKGQLTQYVEPPSPLLLTNKRWEMQDANWFPDFPASAEKILWFYRHSRGMTADGVIAVNASVLERLLSLTGPITDEKRQLTLTSENVIASIQEVVEFGDEKKAHKPKQILADLAPKFLEYFASVKSDALLPLLSNLQDALANKEIQLYFTDRQTEEVMKEFGWAGQIIDTKPGQDYLFVVNTNIHGKKSDALIKQKIFHQAVIQDDGNVLVSVTITRVHNGKMDAGLYGQTNIDYVRMYAPEGSELLGAVGFTWPDEKKFQAPEPWYKKDVMLSNVEKEVGVDYKSGTRVTNEFNKTVFSNWIITEPGQKNEAQFVYKLPFKTITEQSAVPFTVADLFEASKQTANYQLIAQRQSGIESGFESQIIFPDGWRLKWTDGQDVGVASNGITIGPAILNRDMVWSVVMGKE